MANTASLFDSSAHGLIIPPRPSVLVEISRELESTSPDLRRVAAIIVRDVGLSSAMLRVANSPTFGLRRKIGSIPHALTLLGAKNIADIVTGIVLRQTVGGKGQSMDRFWDSAEKVAGIASFVAGLLPRVSCDEAYTLGLFRDVGIPILIQRFPAYRETLKLAAGDDCAMVTLEESRHGTNHMTVGFLVARAWHLPEILCEAVQRHHDMTVFDDSSLARGGPATLVALNVLSEHLHDEILRGRTNIQWGNAGLVVLDHLGLTHSEYRDIADEISSQFA